MFPPCLGGRARLFARRRLVAALCLALPFVLLRGIPSRAQSVSPVIVEYKLKGAGRFQITNGGLVPMAVVLEPKSFSVGIDGKPIYRPLDPAIHLDLSTMSFRIAPQESFYVFYKVRADTLPAWFTVYAVLSSVRKEDGLKMRIMLPHTVYLYQKAPISKDAIHIQQAAYNPSQNTVICDLENTSASLVRVQGVLATAGGKEQAQGNGFPLLPRSSRHIEIPWKQADSPTSLTVRFPHFVVKEPVTVKSQ